MTGDSGEPMATPLNWPLKLKYEVVRTWTSFKEDMLRLFRHVLTTSYFSFNGQFYEQIDGVVMNRWADP
jgi:hypothetical protein